MQLSQLEIIIIKPTAAFLSLLSSQLPEMELPSLQTMKMDCTACVLNKQKNDEETLNEIERHYMTLFRYEVSRWMGDQVLNKVEVSFLDFLCCFKFEIHSRIVMMTPSIKDGRQLLCIKPRSVLLKWVRSTLEEQSDSDLVSVLERVNAFCLAENAMVIVNNFNQSTDIKPFIKQHYQPIFEAEMLRIYDKAEEWPEMDSYQTFHRYFSVETHSKLVHLY